MTAKEAAAYLRISRTSLQRLYLATGKLTPANPPPGVGLSRPRRFLFRAADVYALAMPHLDAAPPRLLAEDAPPGYDPHDATRR